MFAVTVAIIAVGIAGLGLLTVQATLRPHGRPHRCIVADRSAPGTCRYHIDAQPGLELGVYEQLERVISAELQRQRSRDD